MSEDKSDLERRLFDLMREYEKPVSGFWDRWRYGLLGLAAASLFAVGVIVGPRIFTQTPTSTAYLPQPTPTLESVIESPTPSLGIGYQMIPLQGVGSSSPEGSNLGLEAGVNNLLDIPFETGWTVTTQCADRSGLPTTALLGISVMQPRNVYFLLQAGWALKEFDGKELGSILLDLYNGNHIEIEVPLILGYNIRDWSRNKPEAVNTATSPMLREAWRGIAPDGHTGGMDVLTIEIPEEYHNSTLTSIQINDNSITATGSENPCIHLLAVTVEYIK